MNPFSLSAYHGPDTFCDRDNETRQLLEAATNGRNVTLYALRRMGKTGLLHHLKHRAAEMGFDALYLDLLPTENQGQMVNLLAGELLKLQHTGAQWLERVSQVIKNLRPIILFVPISGSPQVEFKFYQSGQDFGALTAILQELDSTGKKVIVALDEFQQVLTYPEKKTESSLRSIIQPLKNIRFIYSGSSTHLLLAMFGNHGRPFYQSTQMMHLEPIDPAVYANFITLHMAKGNIELSQAEAHQLIALARNHTYYVQLLCNRLYANGPQKVTENTIVTLWHQIIDESGPLYHQYRQMLTKGQWAVLKAIANEHGQFQINSKAFIGKHKLGAVSSVNRSLEALLRMELVYHQPEGSRYVVYDVVFESWMRKYYPLEMFT